MNTSQFAHQDSVYSGLVTVAITGSIFLVAAASSMTSNIERHALLVDGHGILLATVASAFALRALSRWVIGKVARLSNSLAAQTESAMA